VLVLVSAFAHDTGESVNTFIADPPPACPCHRSCRPTRFLFLDKAKLHRLLQVTLH
jgi:hypothetical protein